MASIETSGAAQHHHRTGGPANNDTDIAPLTRFTTLTAPVIAQPRADKARNYTAAATLNIPVGLAQATGNTAITTFAPRGAGSK
jgi:hypothetical protein